jgi:polar amino acid transport system substrate-binding protein
VTSLPYQTAGTKARLARLIPALALALALAAGPAAGAECLDAVRAKGQLVVGTSPDYPPFEILDQARGVPSGLDIDLAGMIAKDLGLQVRFVSLRFAGLPDALAAGEIDMIAAAMTATEERRKAIDFSDPYISGPNAIVARRDAKELNGLSDLSGRKVAVLAGSSLEKVAKSVQGAEVKPFASYTEAFKGLLTGQVQALLVHLSVARPFLDKHQDLTVTAELDAPLGIGFGFRKDCPDLRAKVDDVLEKLETRGAIADLIAKWFR